MQEKQKRVTEGDVRDRSLVEKFQKLSAEAPPLDTHCQDRVQKLEKFINRIKDNDLLVVSIREREH